MADNTKLSQLAEALNIAIAQAEHKPGQWSGTAQSMGGICTTGEPFQIGQLPTKEEPWAHFSYKRDAWLAVAAVNALPELIGLIADLDDARNGMKFSPALRLKKEIDRLQALVADYLQGTKAEADAGDEARAECRTLKAKLQVAESALKSAISTAQWQAFTNREMSSAREEIVKLTDEVERLEAFHSNQKHSARVWRRCFEVAEKERDAAIVRASYWKQRAKSAEGHLFASDFEAAVAALHQASNYAEMPYDELSGSQRAHIDHGVAAVVVAINARRAIRRPGEEAEVDNG